MTAQQDSSQNTVAGVSLPSIPVAVLDTREVQSFTSTFVYVFFASDELTSEPQSITQSPVDSVRFARTVPRYVKLAWVPVTVNSEGTIQQDLVDISLEQNASRIVSEDDIRSRFYTTYNQQENAFVAQTQAYLDRLYRQLGYDPTNASMSDVIRAIHESTPEMLSQEFLNRYLSYSNSEVTATRTMPVAPVYNTENIVVHAPVLNGRYGTMMHDKLVNDSLTDISSDMSSMAADGLLTQTAVRQYMARFNANQYNVDLGNPIKSVVDNESADVQARYHSTGYVIERFRIAGDGSRVERRVFFIEDPAVANFIDTSVRYAQTYMYSIRSVTALKISRTDALTANNVRETYLISSGPVATYVTCVDKTPPEPPTDFFVRWDYGLNKPVLTWSFPVDSRRHVKYFQVFRRKNVGSTRPAQMPFELVRMYDFNDLSSADGVIYATVKDPRTNRPLSFGFLQNGENLIDSAAIINILNQTGQNQSTATCYVDDDFNKEDYYIYAVAAIDAHGLTSNYSNQIGIKFNKQRNTIDRVDISVPGAPKPYPNLYLNKDAFIDTIKNEGYSQMTIVFNPEYLDLRNQSGDDLGLIKYGPGNKLKIQLINLDLQTDGQIDIVVHDDRN